MEANQQASWGNLQINRRAITYVKPSDCLEYKIAVYESVDTLRNDPKVKPNYFFSPIVLLDPSTAEYKLKPLTKQHIVSFEIEMWNEDVEKRVISFLKDKMGFAVNDAQVHIIPFEELTLKTTDPAIKLFTVPPTWKLYQQQKRVTFELICLSSSQAQELVEALKKEPLDFKGIFKVNFALSTRKSQRRETFISMESVTNGDFFSRLDQRFKDTEQVYLNAQDLNTLLGESVNKVMVETFCDDEEAGPGSETTIYNTLKEMMVAAKETTEKFTEHMWDSVFWNSENSRPDKVAKTLNEHHQKLDASTQSKLIKTVENKSAWSQDVHADVNVHVDVNKMITGLINGSRDLKSKQDTSNAKVDAREKTQSFSYEDVSKVKWNGEKFVPKPMTLSRINMSNIRNRQTYESLATRVAYSDILSIAVNVPPGCDKKSISAIERLQNKLTQLGNDVEIVKNTLGYIQKDYGLVKLS